MTPSEGYRLSPPQERLWRLARLEAGPFRSWVLLEVRGELDASSLERALRAVVERHEILRTTFRRHPELEIPLQFVPSEPRIRFEEHDLEAIGDPGSAERQFSEMLDRLKARRIDLQEGPVLRATWFRMGPRHGRLLLELPSLCGDAASLEIVADEIRRGCAGGASGDAVAEPELQYPDVAQWMLDLVDGADAGPGRGFWRRRRAESPALRQGFPWNERVPSGGRFDPGTVTRQVPADLYAELDRVARCRDCSMQELLLTAWNLLMWRMAGRSTVDLGVLNDGRVSEDLRYLPGLFARYLPLEVSFDPSIAFDESLDRTRRELAEIGRWQEFFCWSDVTRDADRDDRFSVCFDYTRPPACGPAAGAAWTSLRHGACLDRFELRLACVEAADGLRLEIHHDPSRIDVGEAGRMGERLLALLRGAAANPESPIHALGVLSPDERRRLIVEFNDTATDYPRDRCVHELLEDQARRTPDAVAIHCGTERARFGEIDDEADRLSRHLLDRGVAPGDLVGICIERSVDMVVSVLAVLKAGAAYVPLDPGYPEERLRFMLEDTGASWLISREQIVEGLPDSPARVVSLDAEAAAIARQPAEKIISGARPEDLAYVIYTSGSTGKPKGVMITHRGLMISNQARIAYFVDPVERFLLLSSFSFDSSLVGIFWTLLTGGCLYLIDEATQQDPARLASFVADNRISHLLTLPSFWGLILETAEASQLDCLKTVIVAGEACTRAAVDAHRRLLPDCGLFSEYGATETTIFSSVYDCSRQTRPTAPLGEPIDNSRMYVLDPDLQPLPIGVAGEVYFGGPALSPGYLNRPELTAERFVPDTISGDHGARLYRSGDRARYLPTGEIEFLGRTDNQVKIRGFRVELEEIEAVLSEHPGVRHAAVGVDETSSGKRLVGYVVAAAGSAPAAAELREYLLGRLPDYMVPALFVPMDELPKTPVGKLDREALPAPDTVALAADDAHAGPRDRTEEILAAIWAEVLAVERVGIHDNFFELGGDSILSIHIVSRARAAGLSVSPVQIFEHQTVAELAAGIGESETPTADQDAICGEVPLTPIQRWFCELDVANRNHWNMPLLLEMTRPVDIQHLRRAARMLTLHHDALRTTLVRTGDGWRQSISAPEAAPPVEVELEDLSLLSDEVQRLQLGVRAAGHQRRLDLERGRLMHLAVFDRGASRPRLLLWVVHHLVVDIVSWRILLEDLQTLLQQLESGRTLELPAKTTDVKRWSETLQRHAESSEVLEEAEFWRRELPAVPGRLPVDNVGGREKNVEASLRQVTSLLSVEETEALLHRLPRACDGRIGDALLAALVEVLSGWTGEHAFLIDVEGHGRDEAIADGIDLSRTVGWFTAFHPLVLRREPGGDPRQAVESIRKQFDRVPGRGLGYGLLRYLHRAGVSSMSMRQLPVAEINFNYLGRFEGFASESDLFELACRELDYGADRDPRGRRSHLLELVAWIVDERLEMTWSFSENAHRDATIQRLSKGYVTWLRALIRACDYAGPLDRAGPEFGWNRSDMADIAARISATIETRHERES